MMCSPIFISEQMTHQRFRKFFHIVRVHHKQVFEKPIATGLKQTIRVIQEIVDFLLRGYREEVNHGNTFAVFDVML